MTDVQSIITQLEQQKDAIERALSALREIASAPGGAPRKRRGRPARNTVAASAGSSRPQISEAGRQRLAEAMKRRWAAKRAAGKAPRRARKKASE